MNMASFAAEARAFRYLASQVRRMSDGEHDCGKYISYACAELEIDENYMDEDEFLEVVIRAADIDPGFEKAVAGTGTATDC